MVFIGIIKIRDLPSGKCVKEFGSINVIEQGELSEGATPPGYTQLLYHNQLDSITAVTVGHNIIYKLPELGTNKQESHLNVVCIIRVFYKLCVSSCNFYVLKSFVYCSR